MGLKDIKQQQNNLANNGLCRESSANTAEMQFPLQLLENETQLATMINASITRASSVRLRMAGSFVEELGVTSLRVCVSVRPLTCAVSGASVDSVMLISCRC